MAKLESKRLNKHLRNIKAGEEDTSLAIATKGNGAKVDGDLEITGSYKGPVVIDGRFITTHAAQPLNIHADKITMEPEGGTGTVNITVDGNNIFILDSLYGFSIYNILDTPEDNAFNIHVGSNGITTMSTEGVSLADLLARAK